MWPPLRAVPLSAGRLSPPAYLCAVRSKQLLVAADCTPLLHISSALPSGIVLPITQLHCREEFAVGKHTWAWAGCCQPYGPTLAASTVLFGIVVSAVVGPVNLRKLMLRGALIVSW